MLIIRYAPESLKYGKFSHKSDVWSYGVTLWEMFSYGEHPTYPGGVTDSNLIYELERGIRLQIPAADTPAEVYALMMTCWRAESAERPSFTELKQSFESMGI